MLISDSDVFHDPVMCHDLAFVNQNSREYAYSTFIQTLFLLPSIHDKYIMFLPPCLINTSFFMMGKIHFLLCRSPHFWLHPNEGAHDETWWLLWWREIPLKVIMKYSTLKGYTWLPLTTHWPKLVSWRPQWGQEVQSHQDPGRLRGGNIQRIALMAGRVFNSSASGFYPNYSLNLSSPMTNQVNYINASS